MDTATSRFGQRLTSPTGILVMIPTLVLAVGLVVAGAGVFALRSSLLEVANRSFAEAAGDAAEALDHCRRTADPLLGHWLGWLAEGGREAELEVQARMLEGLLLDRDEVAWLSWSSADGSFVGANRQADGALHLVVHTGGRRTAYAIGPEGLDPISAREDPYVPRERPFWQPAVDGVGLTWIEPYRFAEGDVGLSAAQALRAADGDVLGVATVDFSLSSLAGTVARLSAACRGTVFVADADGTLLAWPDPNDLPLDDERLPRLADLDDPALPALLDALSHGDGDRPVRFAVDGVDFLGRVQRNQLDLDQDWYVAAYAPTAAFLQPTRALRLQAAAVAGLGLLAALGCAWWLARSINRHRAALRRAEARVDSAEARVRELGSYDLLRKLGEGGMGEVWLARHRLLARPAAVKLIHTEQLAKHEDDLATAIERFEREARHTATLRSRNTVEIYDYGTSGDGTVFLVMELLEGMDLFDLVTKHGPPALARTIGILRQACHSLAEAHEHGLVHRDIKPGNIFLCRRADELDIVKVLDFGMALDRHQAPSQRLTQEGFVSGTPGYMAPEQARGMAVDGRSDIYALGCVGYFLLTGQMVFDKPSAMDLMLAHVNDDPIPPNVRAERSIPGALENLILSCLAKDPTQRPQTARELDAALAAVVVPEHEGWDVETMFAWWGCTDCFRMDPEEFARCEALKRIGRSRRGQDIDALFASGSSDVDVLLVSDTGGDLPTTR